MEAEIVSRLIFAIATPKNICHSEPRMGEESGRAPSVGFNLWVPCQGAAHRVPVDALY